MLGEEEQTVTDSGSDVTSGGAGLHREHREVARVIAYPAHRITPGDDFDRTAIGVNGQQDAALWVGEFSKFGPRRVRTGYFTDIDGEGQTGNLPAEVNESLRITTIHARHLPNVARPMRFRVAAGQGPARANR